MTRFQKYLRAMIATGSVMGFFGGWVLIAHSGKPAATLTPSSAIVAPAPLPRINAPSSMQPLPPMRSTLRPRLRTGGS